MNDDFTPPPRKTPKVVACPHCGALVRRRDRHCPYCAHKLGFAWNDFLRMNRWLRHPHLATRALMAGIILFFAMQMVAEQYLKLHGLPERFRADFLATLPGRAGPGLLMQLESHPEAFAPWLEGGCQPASVWRGWQFWRLVTYNFLHGGLLHLLFNLFALRTLGMLCERVWDRRATWAGFLFGGLAGGLLSAAQVLWNPTMWIGTTLGASGAICGLLGMLWGAYRGPSRWAIGDFLGTQIKFWVFAMLVFSVLAHNEVSWTAHVGGLAAGYALGRYVFIPHAVRFGGRRHTVWAAAAGVVCGLGVLGWVGWLLWA